METRRFIMKRWPLFYSISWIIWAILAPEPHFAGSNNLSHVLAVLGIFGLIMMGTFPHKIYARFVGLLLAVLYPFHRSLAIIADKQGIPDVDRRIVAFSLSITIVVSLLLLYPSLLWATRDIGEDNEE